MNLPPEIRKRLQELNRGPLTFRKKDPAGSESGAEAAEHACGDAGGIARPCGDPAGPVKLEDAVAGEEIASAFGRVYLIRKSASRMMPDAATLLRHYATVFCEGGMAWREGSLHPDLRPLLDLDPRRVLFLDIETTGLSAQPIFLIGLMHYTGSDLHLHQFLARDYSEERAMLASFAERMPNYQALVTFNGKSFDVPFIRDRGVANGIEVEFEGVHVDLLHEARRRWRGKLPDCRLQTLERCLLKRVRSGDIPGELIPQAYHDFVHSGNAFQICDIVHHNALDLVAMSEILLHMIRENDE